MARIWRQCVQRSGRNFPLKPPSDAESQPFQRPDSRVVIESPWFGHVCAQQSPRASADLPANGFHASQFADRVRGFGGVLIKSGVTYSGFFLGLKGRNCLQHHKNVTTALSRFTIHRPNTRSRPPQIGDTAPCGSVS